MSKNEKTPAKLTFSRPSGDGYETVQSPKDATGITLWRNDETDKSWRNLVKAVEAKFSDSFHRYQMGKTKDGNHRLMLLRNREVDARAFLESDDSPF